MSRIVLASTTTDSRVLSCAITNAKAPDVMATKPPTQQAPTTSNHWISTGPHVMVMGADQAFYDGYPKGADPDTSSPYVMWAGTPYEHLMLPVK